MIGNPKLREKSSEITNEEELEQVIEDLKDTLHYLQKTKLIGRALAAPQIDYPKRVIYYDLPNGESFVMVNPKITQMSSKKFWVWDSCFSFDVAFFVEIERYKRITVEYLDETGNTHLKDYEDDLSELIQHEIDHLNGILATDHLKDVKKIISRQEWEKKYQNKE
jgi:peptide deformylase